MKDHAADDQIIEMAALYALGAMSQGEATAFESHLAEGCETCLAQVAAFEEVAGNIGLASEESTPKAEVRDALLACIQSDGERPEPKISPEIFSVRACEGEWSQIAEGILIKVLSMDEATGVATSLVRMSPGMRLEPHRHKGIEEIFILEGDCCVDDATLGPGDYHRAVQGSVHLSTYTVHGTMFLLRAPLDYEFISTT
ncbi:MAG TPA: cupin domain-containing protein [Blastocatellia bacterium]